MQLPHRVMTFTAPKMLRAYFRYHPELFAELSRLIYRLVRQFHPQWHGIFLEGGFDHDGRFLHIPFGNLEKMA